MSFCAWCSRWFVVVDGATVYLDSATKADTHSICRDCHCKTLMRAAHEELIAKELAEEYSK